MTTLRAVLWGDPAGAADLSAALRRSAHGALGDGFDEITVNTIEPGAPSFGVSAFPGASPVVLVGARHGEGAEGDGRLLRWLGEAGDRLAVYEVDEALPLDHERTWPDGEASPGAKQVTLFRRKPGMTDEAFLSYWHEQHTPLAMRIHPLWRYSRCVVRRAVSPGAPTYEGIVELHFRALEDITDPMRLFGGDVKNVRVIQKDVAQFIDMATISVTVTREHVLRRRAG